MKLPEITKSTASASVDVVEKAPHILTRTLRCALFTFHPFIILLELFSVAPEALVQ